MKKRNFPIIITLLVIVIWIVSCRGDKPKAATDPTATNANPTSGPTNTALNANPTSSPTITAENATPIVDEPAAPTPTPVENELPTATPPPTAVEESSDPTPTPEPVQPDCVDQATFVKDVTIPDGQLFEPNVSFTKTWRLVNSGTCTWGSGYQLVHAGGDIMNGNLSNPIPLVAPGESVDISIEMTSPNRFGEKIGHWLLENAAGQQFGTGLPAIGQLWVQINIVSPSSGSAPTPPPSSEGCAIQFDSDYESQILTLINQARATNGLTTVSMNSQLSAAALAHSTDMACNGFVDHVGSDGSTWLDRVAEQGYANAALARENIYVGDPAFGGTAQGAFEWWMNSQVHRDNILYTQVREIGIAYVYLPGSAFGGYYTLVLAWP